MSMTSSGTEGGSISQAETQKGQRPQGGREGGIFGEPPMIWHDWHGEGGRGQDWRDRPQPNPQRAKFMQQVTLKVLHPEVWLGPSVGSVTSVEGARRRGE